MEIRAAPSGTVALALGEVAHIARKLKPFGRRRRVSKLVTVVPRFGAVIRWIEHRARPDQEHREHDQDQERPTADRKQARIAQRTERL
jgi:hypothetical protein